MTLWRTTTLFLPLLFTLLLLTLLSEKPPLHPSGSATLTITDLGLNHVSNAGPMESQLIPSHWFHSQIPGPGQTMWFPPGTTQLVHVDAGTPQDSSFVPPDWVHRDLNDYTIYTDPDDQHVIIPSDYETKYLPPTGGSFIHVTSGPSATEKVPPDAKHNTYTGSFDTQWYPPDFQHVTYNIPGLLIDQYTQYVPPDWVHYKSTGPLYSLMCPPFQRVCQFGSEPVGEGRYGAYGVHSIEVSRVL